MQTTPIEGIDWPVVEAWMDTQGLPPGRIDDVNPLAGGTQNIMVRFERGGRSYVFRRGPLHLRKRSNDVIRREMRVLQALSGTDVPHPGFIAGCPEDTVMGGAVFYLMEPVDGFNPTVELTPAASTPQGRRAMGLAAASALARLGAVDYRAVGLGDVGQPEGFLERQVGRWLGELESYTAIEGYPGGLLTGVPEAASWLDAHMPPEWTPGLIHGDYHLANLMLDRETLDVAAIVDWEMCTVGDPLLDLGWLIATSGDRNPGGPTPEEMVAEYGKHSARDLDHMRWYTVMACFKLGIVLEGTNARAHGGLAPTATGDLLHAMATGLLQQAGQLIRD